MDLFCVGVNSDSLAEGKHMGIPQGESLSRVVFVPDVAKPTLDTKPRRDNADSVRVRHSAEDTGKHLLVFLTYMTLPTYEYEKQWNIRTLLVSLARRPEIEVTYMNSSLGSVGL